MSTTTRPTAVPNTPAQRAADAAIAKRAVLKLADFPLGWTGEVHHNSPDNNLPPAVERNFEACSHFPKRLLDDTSDKLPKADSFDFSRGRIGAGPAAEVQNTVELDRTAKAISDPLSYLAAPGLPKCLEPVFHAIFNEGIANQPSVSLTDFSIRALSVNLGDNSAGFQGRVSITGPRSSIPLEFNLYFVQVDRSIVEMTAIAFSVPFDQQFAQTLLKKVVDRARAGLTTE